jgi:hypothetical protein
MAYSSQLTIVHIIFNIVWSYITGNVKVQLFKLVFESLFCNAMETVERQAGGFSAERHATPVDVQDGCV